MHDRPFFGYCHKQGGHAVKLSSARPCQANGSCVAGYIVLFLVAQDARNCRRFDHFALGPCSGFVFLGSGVRVSGAPEYGS